MVERVIQDLLAVPETNSPAGTESSMAQGSLPLPFPPPQNGKTILRSGIMGSAPLGGSFALRKTIAPRSTQSGTNLVTDRYHE